MGMYVDYNDNHFCNIYKMSLNGDAREKQLDKDITWFDHKWFIDNNYIYYYADDMTEDNKLYSTELKTKETRVLYTFNDFEGCYAFLFAKNIVMKNNYIYFSTREFKEINGNRIDVGSVYKVVVSDEHEPECVYSSESFVGFFVTQNKLYVHNTDNVSVIDL